MKDVAKGGGVPPRDPPSDYGSLFDDIQEAEDHFALLGEPLRYRVDFDAMQKRFILLSRELHPDLWRRHSPAEHLLAQRLSAALNEAYMVLRDDFKRAEYLINLLGGPSQNADKSVPKGFLMEVFQLKKTLPKAKAEDDRAKLDAVREDLGARLDHWRGKVADALESACNGSEDRAAALEDARLGQNVIVYLKNLLNELDE